tara:strand:- start:113 stop:658 length:546 start_codon:yes stop_codon:yes gene_type:complete
MNDNEYTLTRSAFAKSIGKSLGSVKQAMRRGNYRDQYVVRNGQYFFRPVEGLRENHGPDLGTPVPTKRKINRGNHEKAHYPNEAFRQHNEIKKLISLQKKVDPIVAEEYVSGFDKWQQQQRQKVQRDISMSIPKNYGGMITGPQTVYVKHSTKWTELEPKKKDEYDEYETKNKKDSWGPYY